MPGIASVLPPAPAAIRRASLALAASATFALSGLVPAPALAQAAPRSFTVSSPTELITALRAARAGDTVLLNPGFYGNINVFRIRITGGMVSIRSADPANRARFGQVKFSESSGLALAGVDAQSALSPVMAAGSSSDIRLTGNRIRGANANQDAFDDTQSGLWVRNSQRVMVASNDFQDLRTTMWIQRSSQVAVRHNSFTFVREGINVSGSTRGDISRNLFDDFQPNHARFEHPDGIQFWTTNETTGNSYFTIRQNLLSFGSDGDVQGIFLGTEDPALPHSNLEVSGNIYYGASQHGISLGSVNSSRIFNNVVVASPWADKNNTTLYSPDGRTGGGIQPYIRLGIGTDVVASKNVVMHLSGTGPGRVGEDNVDLYDTYFKKGEPWTSVLNARPTSRHPAVSEFVTRAGTSYASRGIGITQPFQVGVVTLDPVQALAFAATQPLP